MVNQSNNYKEFPTRVFQVLSVVHSVLYLARIPSGTDGWMEYVPISEKKNNTIASLQNREGTVCSAKIDPSLSL